MSLVRTFAFVSLCVCVCVCVCTTIKRRHFLYTNRCLQICSLRSRRCFKGTCRIVHQFHHFSPSEAEAGTSAQFSLVVHANLDTNESGKSIEVLLDF
jgi:hypothetical protein